MIYGGKIDNNDNIKEIKLKIIEKIEEQHKMKAKQYFILIIVVDSNNIFPDNPKSSHRNSSVEHGYEIVGILMGSSF